MNDVLTATSGITILLVAAAFLFAVVMQPIFVWIICVRLKRTNQLLAKIEKQNDPRGYLRR
jgi:isoprenylcysteine carboxyl methyltransferase (ICMT) family protein YpbQ